MKNFRPIIFWEGLPVCGLLMKKVCQKFGDDLMVVATRAAVPFADIEKMLGHKVVWLESPNDIWERREEFSDRNFVLHTGWAHKGWLRFGKFLKEKNGAKIVLVSDNRFRGDLRQILGAIYFRLFLKKHFDGALCTGMSARRLLSFLGMEKKDIYYPNYGAFEEIYKETRPILERAKEFLFVGQLIKRKSVDLILEAFKEYRKEGGKWSLRLSGSGELEKECGGEGITCEGFLQPKEVVERMNNARVLVFPSRHDNWGTALCEAAACGMLLISSKTTGASEDILMDKKNGILLDKIGREEIKKAFFEMENLGDEEIEFGSRASKQIASRFDSNAYYNAFMRMKLELFDEQK